MMINYLEEFPISKDLLPKQLVDLLSPINSSAPDLMVEITNVFEKREPNLEFCTMVMTTIPEQEIDSFNAMAINYSVRSPISEPSCDNKGDLADGIHSLNNNYLITSWGGGVFFKYTLSETVSVMMNLSPRCFFNKQELAYDDLERRVMEVAQGSISSEYSFGPNRNVIWKMRNDYLRRYLWMRGHIGIRSFHYQCLLPKDSAVQNLTKGIPHYVSELENGWCQLDIKDYDGQSLLQVWATVVAILPELCPERDARTLIWPGDDSPIKEYQIGSNSSYPYIYLKDNFLKKYEENEIYDCIPVVNHPDNIFLCSPSYKGQWAFTGLRRIGRNIIQLPASDLYRSGIPNNEILHAYRHAISPAEAYDLTQTNEHIVKKTKDLVEEILCLGGLFSRLALALELSSYAIEEYVEFNPTDLQNNNWLNYPGLCKLARVAPLDMPKDDFLSRCKTLHECLSKIKTIPLRMFLSHAGIANNELKELKSLRLLLAIKNILDFLIDDNQTVASWKNSALSCTWNKHNPALSVLFCINMLRQEDAHEKNSEWVSKLEDLGFDSAHLSCGYGIALDFIFDQVTNSIRSINSSLSEILAR